MNTQGYLQYRRETKDIISIIESDHPSKKEYLLTPLGIDSVDLTTEEVVTIALEGLANGLTTPLKTIMDEYYGDRPCQLEEVYGNVKQDPSTSKGPSTITVDASIGYLGKIADGGDIKDIGAAVANLKGLVTDRMDYILEDVFSCNRLQKLFLPASPWFSNKQYTIPMGNKTLTIKKIESPVDFNIVAVTDSKDKELPLLQKQDMLTLLEACKQVMTIHPPAREDLDFDIDSKIKAFTTANVNKLDYIKKLDDCYVNELMMLFNVALACDNMAKDIVKYVKTCHLTLSNID